MSAFQLPNSHVFITTGNELSLVIGIELDIKYWEVASVSKSECPVLFPLKDLE